MKPQQIHILGAGFCGTYMAHRLLQNGYHVSIIDPHIIKRMKADNLNHTDGIGQSPHLHVLLNAGLTELCESYSDFQTFLNESHCPEIDWANDTVWASPFGIAPVYESNLKTRSLSRVHLDRFMMESLRHREKLSLIEESVSQLIIENKTTVGIVLKNGTRISTELVIDCRGRGSEIILDLAIDKPSLQKIETTAPANIMYRSQLLSGVKNTKQYYEQPWPPSRLDGAVLTPIENGQAILTLIHYGQTKLSRLPFAESVSELDNPKFLGALKGSITPSVVQKYFFKSCIRREFSKLAQFPNGLVVLGDACVQLNPVFGQGMSIGARSVNAAVGHLHKTSTVKGLQKIIERESLIAWMMSSNNPGSIGHLALEYVLKRSFSSPRRHKKFLAVQHLVRHPLSLLTPTI